MAPAIQNSNADVFTVRCLLGYNSTFQLHSASTHGSELAYVFGIPLYNAWDTFYMAKFNRQDETVSRAVMTYWTNFAKTG